MHLQEVLCLQSPGIQALLSDQASLAKPLCCHCLQSTLGTLRMGRPEDLTENACESEYIAIQIKVYQGKAYVVLYLLPFRATWASWSLRKQQIPCQTLMYLLIVTGSWCMHY